MVLKGHEAHADLSKRDTEEEYAEAVKAYEGRVEAHREKCADITANAEVGEILIFAVGQSDGFVMLFAER